MGYKQSPFPMQKGTSGHSSALKSISPLKQMPDNDVTEDRDEQGVMDEGSVGGQFLTPTGDGKFYDEDNDITFSDPNGIVEMHEGTDYPVDLDYEYKVDSAGNHIITGIKGE